MAKTYPDQEKSDSVAASAGAPEIREQLIYIGPNIPGGTLHRYQVYRGGIPEHLAQIIEKCPAIRSLFVPVANFAAAEQALAMTGSAEHTLFREVASFTTKGGK